MVAVMMKGNMVSVATMVLVWLLSGPIAAAMGTPRLQGYLCLVAVGIPIHNLALVYQWVPGLVAITAPCAVVSVHEAALIGVLASCAAFMAPDVMVVRAWRVCDGCVMVV